LFAGQLAHQHDGILGRDDLQRDRFRSTILMPNETQQDLHIVGPKEHHDADYNRRTHKRQIARALRGWMAFLTEGRDFRLMPDAAWKHRSMPFDAHFDGDFWFYFRSRAEMTAFRVRYKSAWTMRRTGREWKRVRITE